MHEALLTRGDVSGASPEVAIQIFVPWNVVLVHEGACHLLAQHESEGKRKSLVDLLRYHSPETITDWLDYMGAHLRGSAVQEARSFLDAYLSDRL